VSSISGGQDGAAAVNATTGKELWGGSPVNRLVCSSPAVANGMVYADSGPAVAALNASTGKLLWFIGNASGSPSPAVANGLLYLATDTGVLYALNASTGKELWHSHIPFHGNQSSPVVANGRLYLGSGSKQVFAFAP
jgi:eukaryotic-like serine/threonine-protein kinase